MLTATQDIHALRATQPVPLPFAPSLHIRAFLLEREHGNLLVYASPSAEPGELEGAGGVARQYLNHRHEASFLSESLRPPLFAHERERDAVSAKRPLAGSFSERAAANGDFELIPTPGHTPGATAFLWDNGRERVLFTGDTIYLDGGEWVAAVLESSDRAAYLESLELLRGLDFDVLLPWAASAGEPYLALTDRDDARRRIGAIIERVRGGESR